MWKKYVSFDRILYSFGRILVDISTGNFSVFQSIYNQIGRVGNTGNPKNPVFFLSLDLISRSFVLRLRKSSVWVFWNQILSFVETPASDLELRRFFWALFIENMKVLRYAKDQWKQIVSFGKACILQESAVFCIFANKLSSVPFVTHEITCVSHHSSSIHKCFN